MKDTNITFIPLSKIDVNETCNPIATIEIIKEYLLIIFRLSIIPDENKFIFVSKETIIKPMIKEGIVKIFFKPFLSLFVL